MLNRTLPPATASLAVPTLLIHDRQTLENGIELISIHDPAQEVFKIDVIFEAGAYYQPQPLIAATTINMLNEGTLHHSADELAELFDYHGAYIDFNCGMNKAELNLVSLNKYAQETIRTLAEMVNESVFPEKELEIFLRNKRQEYLVNIEKTAYLARKEFIRLMFGAAHPYANNIQESDYRNVSRPLLEEFYRQRFNAEQCKIMLSGNINETVRHEAIMAFSSLGKATASTKAKTFDFTPAQPGRYHITKNDSVQTSIRIGKTGVMLTNEDYAGFLLLNTVLGGYFGSRLMSNIREEKGYTYGINSFNVTMPLTSFWCVATDVNKDYAQATIDETIKEIRLLQTELIPEEELKLVKNYVHGDLLRELDGVFSQADALKHKLNYGLDNNIYISIVNKINACKSEELLELANKYLNIEQLYIVTAGEQDK